MMNPHIKEAYAYGVALAKKDFEKEAFTNTFPSKKEILKRLGIGGIVGGVVGGVGGGLAGAEENEKFNTRNALLGGLAGAGVGAYLSKLKNDADMIKTLKSLGWKEHLADQKVRLKRLGIGGIVGGIVGGVGGGLAGAEENEKFNTRNALLGGLAGAGVGAEGLAYLGKLRGAAVRKRVSKYLGNKVEETVEAGIDPLLTGHLIVEKAGPDVRRALLRIIPRMSKKEMENAWQKVIDTYSELADGSITLNQL